MDWDVTDVKAIEGYALAVKFQDGTQGLVRFKPEFFRGVFSNLQDRKQFEQVQAIDGVVTWPGDIDLAPDAMHRQIRAKGEWVLD